MSNPFNTPRVKKLTTLWYEKLKEEGFSDIENTTHDLTPLRVWHSLKWANTSDDKREATLLYYTKAKELLETHPFENEIHRRIWELHCDGFSKRKIEKLIATLPKACKREQIGKIINLIASEIL